MAKAPNNPRPIRPGEGRTRFDPAPPPKAGWKKLTEAVERKLGARVYAFDPGVAVCLPCGRGSATLPLWVAQKIAGLDA